MSEAKSIFDSNTVGPRAYVKMYDKYKDILTGQSLNDKEEFLKSEATLDQFRVSFLNLDCHTSSGYLFVTLIVTQANGYQEQMTRYANLRDEISQIRKVIDKANNIWLMFDQYLISIW